MLFKICSSCCYLESPWDERSQAYKEALSKYTIEKEDGLYIDIDTISDLQVLLRAAEEFYDSDDAPDHMWKPPYDLIVDFKNKEITIYDYYIE